MEKEEIALQILLKMMDKDNPHRDSHTRSTPRSGGADTIFDPEKLIKTFNQLYDGIKVDGSES